MAINFTSLGGEVSTPTEVTPTQSGISLMLIYVLVGILL